MKFRRTVALSIVVAASIVPLLCGCRSLPRVDPDPPQAHVKVLTYNVNCATQDKQAVIRFLAESGADVLCLQETDPAWCEALDAGLAERYPQRLLLPQEGVSGISLLSRHLFLEMAALAPAAGWFPALWAELRSPIGRLRVLNVHLRPSLSDRGSVSIPAYYRVPNIRENEVRGFLQAMPAGLPVVVAGDFNEGDDGMAVRWLRDHGFTDALPLFDKRTYTWRWRVGPVPIGGRFDHLLFSSELICTGTWVQEFRASDHRPVSAVLVAR